ncbi:DUF3953 domain-containing protein [Bacillus sp. KH172YL63]|uniref:DUF3953 domain-containing protein n=1 Tax=Bacillus sp. KH172YL63 TaxID=2709784 RepID=UPI0013E4DE0C|nr:DUF3953 domain-containing protein [Bacillus sp. KH172YL63]BCB05400.1 hypothetical protein KH172YL63_35330 [Bacillus sp. KH172YL63]
MLFKFRVLFSLIAISFALYALFSEQTPDIIYTCMFLALSMMMHMMGLSEIKANRKPAGWLYFSTAVFLGFVMTYSLF